MDIFRTLRGFLSGHEPDEKNYFAYSATLRISGDNLDLEHITQGTGIVPTHTHKKGELHGKIHPTEWKQDMWMFEAPIPEAQPLEDHINTLWGLLKEKKDFIKSLKKKCKVDIFLGYRSNCDTAGIEIPYQSLEMFRELEIPFGLSIIVT